MPAISITLILIIVTGIISFICFQNRELFEKLKHFPYVEKRNKEWYRMFTSGFLHGSWFHLLINVYVLFTFGEVVENAFISLFPNSGRMVFLLFYLVAIVMADIPTYIKHQDDPRFASIGASGAVSAIVFAFILLHPMAELAIVFFPFIPFPAILGGIGYLIYSSYSSQKGGDRIDHLAHFAGGLFGFFFLLALKPSLFGSFIAQIKNGLPF